MGQYGIKETKEVVKFGVELGEAVDRAMSDDKMEVADLVHLVPAFTAAGPAFSDISLVPKEMKDMDEAESKELMDYVESELDIENDQVEEVIEKSLRAVLALHDVYLAVRGPELEVPAPEAAPAS